MFSLCEAMKWNHLPVAGGLYDQDPQLVDGFMIIFSARAEYEAEQERKREREMGKNKNMRRGASRTR